MASDWPRYAEFLLWVAVAGVFVSAVTILVGYVVGDSLVTAKYALFAVGTLLFGLGSFAIQPTPSHRDEKRIAFDDAPEHRFETVVQSLPPLRGRHVAVDRRVSRNVKVFATSLVVLGVSMAMEFWFGVRA